MTTRRLVALLSATTALVLCAAASQATTVTYNDFSSTAGLTLTGSAGTAITGDGTVLRLTSASGSEAGAAYSTTPITLGSGDTFSTQFQFRFTDAGGASPADGITFVLAASPSGLGGSGVGIGYQGVNHSIAIEFDTYDNGNAGSLGFFAQEPDSSNHVAIDTNGVLTDTNPINVYGNGSCGFSNGTPPQNPNTADGCMSNGHLWTANISYDGSKLSATLLDPAEGSTFTVYSNYAIDIGSLLGTNTAYFGFTGSTGAGWENEDIKNLALSNTAQLNGGGSDVPEPATLLIFGAGLIGAGRLRKRKSAS